MAGVRSHTQISPPVPRRSSHQLQPGRIAECLEGRSQDDCCFSGNAVLRQWRAAPYNCSDETGSTALQVGDAFE